MEDNGIEVELEDRTTVSSKIHLMLAIEDLLQADSLAHYYGHSHRAGCRSIQLQAFTIKKVMVFTLLIIVE